VGAGALRRDDDQFCHRALPFAALGQNWLGTDANGGDVLARILYGTRISVLFGLLLTLFSSVLGCWRGDSGLLRR
jgi:ABC-type microcin C transport system permease subunit YejE